jgi:AcrR family transcriptional regulator
MAASRCSVVPDGAQNMASSHLEIDPFYNELWGHVQPETSRRLVVAALDCFAHHGFEGATTRQIADAAGLGPAGVYVHFKSKSELLEEIIRTAHTTVLEEVLAADDAGASASDRLSRFVETFVMWHARHHTLARVAQYELGALEEPAREQIRRIRREFQDLVEDVLRVGVVTGEFEVHDVRGTARAILSLGIDVARWFRGDGQAQAMNLARLYGRLVLRMVRRS